MKKFSRLPALRLIGARQNRFFARIAAADSRARLWLETMNCVAIDARGHTCVHSLDAASMTTA
jgi:hypothetical protein